MMEIDVEGIAYPFLPIPPPATVVLFFLHTHHTLHDLKLCSWEQKFTPTSRFRLVLGRWTVRKQRESYSDMNPFGSLAALVVVGMISTAFSFGTTQSASFEVYTLNMTSARSLDPMAGYETLHLAAALQGLVNRHAPRLFISFRAADEEWWNLERQNGGWLADATVHSLPDLETALNTFISEEGSVVKGIVAWEAGVFPTSLLAGTAAGVKNLLPVIGNSTWMQKLAGMGLKVGLDLRGMFGPGGSHRTTSSIKGDAYKWAMDEWLGKGHWDDDLAAVGNADDGDDFADDDADTTIANGLFQGWFIDAYAAANPIDGFYDKVTLLNHDFVVARSGFFWDLDPFPDNIPLDDPKQPLGTDYTRLTEILAAAYAQTNGEEWTHVSGFDPWAWNKYNETGRGGVTAEWQSVKTASAFNAFFDADACCIGGMASASFWAWRPLPRHLPGAARPSPPSYFVDKGLIQWNGTAYEAVPGKYAYFFYAGDFDSAAWLDSQIMQRWNDPARGSVPIGWPLDPILSRRFPPAFFHLYPAASSNDSFTTGDSGAAYMNPPMLFKEARVNISNFPDATHSWQALSSPLYSRLNLGFSGFLINGASGSITPQAEAVYTVFSPDGIVEEGFPGVNTHLAPNGFTPVFPQTDIPTTPADAINTIITQMHQYVPNPSSPSDVHMYRSVLTSPTYLAQVAQGVEHASNGAAVVLKPQDVAAFARTIHGAPPHTRVSYIDDTLPSEWPVVSQGTQMAAAACHTGPGIHVNFTLRNDGWTNISTTSSSLSVTLTLVFVHRYFGPPRLQFPHGSWEARDTLLRMALSPRAQVIDSTTYTLKLPQPLFAGGPTVQISGLLQGSSPSTCVLPTLDHFSVVIVEYGLVVDGSPLSETGSPNWIEAFHVHRD